MKYLAYIYMNILFGDNQVQNSWNWEKGGDALRYHPVIKNLIKKIWLINFHQKILQ